MCTYHKDNPKISQSSVLARSLATMLVKIVRCGLVLYWIPVLSVISLSRLGISWYRLHLNGVTTASYGSR